MLKATYGCPLEEQQTETLKILYNTSSSETLFGDWLLGSPESSVQTFVPSHLGKGIKSISEMKVPTEQIGSL
jgi:hypothetical protein